MHPLLVSNSILARMSVWNVYRDSNTVHKEIRCLVISHYSLEVGAQGSYRVLRLLLSHSFIISKISSTWWKINYYHKHFSKQQDGKKVAEGQISPPGKLGKCSAYSVATRPATKQVVIGEGSSNTRDQKIVPATTLKQVTLFI